MVFRDFVNLVTGQEPFSSFADIANVLPEYTYRALKIVVHELADYIGKSYLHLSMKMIIN